MMVVPFQPSHLPYIEPQAAQQGQMFSRDLAPALVGTTWTALVDGVPAGVAGIFPLWPGVWQGWAVFGTPVLKQPFALSKAVLSAIVAVEEQGARRIQATVLDGHEAGHRWAKFLGFEIEGLLRNYGSGGTGDHWMYARLAK